MCYKKWTEVTLESNTRLFGVHAIHTCDIGLNFAVSIISRSAVTYYCAKKENPIRLYCIQVKHKGKV